MTYTFDDESLKVALDRLSTFGTVPHVNLALLRYSEGSFYVDSSFQSLTNSKTSPKPTTYYKARVTTTGEKMSFKFDINKRRYTSFTIRKGTYPHVVSEDVEEIASYIYCCCRQLLERSDILEKWHDCLQYLLHRELLLKNRFREESKKGTQMSKSRKQFEAYFRETFDGFICTPMWNGRCRMG